MNGERERSEAGSAIKQTMSAWKKMGKSKYQGCFNSMICRGNTTKKKINLHDSKRIIYVPIVKLMQNLFVMEGLDLSNWHTPNELVEILNNFLYFISIYVGILAKPIKKGVFWVVIFTPTAVTVIRSSIFVLHRFTSFTTVTTV